jgi:arsenate reductase
VSNVLFVCIQNAGRSQISEALFAQIAGTRHRARSAGSRPAGHIHPEVAAVMREAGVDISGNVPHRLDQDDVEWADVVVTMGCGDECPFIPGKRYIDWELDDPAGQSLDRVRRLREEISGRVESLVRELDSQNA